MVKKNYAQYILPVPIKKVAIEGYGPQSVAAHDGELHADATFGFHYIQKAYSEGKPHSHPGHELLFFLGGNPEKLSEFDAEVEMAFGEEGEKQTITSPSLISIPKGLVHCPLTFKRVDKPVFFIEVSLMPGGKFIVNKLDGDTASKK